MTVHVIQGPDGLTRRAFSVEDVRRMTDAGIMDPDEPIELRDGELIAVPAEKYAHARATLAMARKLFRALPDKWAIAQEKTLQLSAETLVQPDFFICASDLIQGSEEGFLIVPGPDLFIIEVADSSLLHDRTQKARLYARHDVREYWIVDLNGRRILVHRRPEDGEYQDVRSIEAEEVVSPDASGMASFQLRLSDLG